MADRNEGQLRKIEQLVEMFSPDYVLPFAKFFELFQPDHEEYRRRMEKNRPEDVRERLADRAVEVVDLLPGERWIGETGDVHRRSGRERLFDGDVVEPALRASYHDHTPIVEGRFELSHDELAAYFEALGGSELAAAVGDHALTLALDAADRTMAALVRFEDGRVGYQPTDEPVDFESVDAESHVIMRCDGRLVQHVVRRDRSWDEIHIGYWCEFERDPDEYNLAFWRLLHAPWEARDDEMRIAERDDIDTALEGVTMADLIEQNDVEDLLSAYGLHCAGCPAGLGEDVLEAARIHGLDRQQMEALVDGLESKVSDS